MRRVRAGKDGSRNQLRISCGVLFIVLLQDRIRGLPVVLFQKHAIHDQEEVSGVVVERV